MEEDDFLKLQQRLELNWSTEGLSRPVYFYKFLEKHQGYFLIHQARSLIDSIRQRENDTHMIRFILFSRVLDYWYINKSDFCHSFIINHLMTGPNGSKTPLEVETNFKSNLQNLRSFMDLNIKWTNGIILSFDNPCCYTGYQFNDPELQKIDEKRRKLVGKTADKHSHS